MDLKNDIKDRLSIEDVVGKYVQLKRAGRNFKGLSPFTSEKTPSFVVSPEKQIWHDFSSNKGGDIFSFVMEVEGLDFKESLELLARQAGLNIDDYKISSTSGTGALKERLYLANKFAQSFFRDNLNKYPEAIRYINHRGIKRGSITDYGMGWASGEGDRLVKALLKEGFPEQEIIKAGLGKDGYGKLSDTFRNRLVVSLTDIEGRVVGFTGRSLSGDNPRIPKYLNTNQTLIYDKGRQVFGLSLAKKFVKEQDAVILVEGNLDVVSLFQAGFKNVAATAGTAMTINHLKQIKRFTTNIYIAYDSDRAGQDATARAIFLAEEADMTLYVIEMPDGYKDPDDVVRHDPELFKTILNSRKYGIDWLLERLKNQFNLSLVPDKKKFATEAIRFIGKIKDPVSQDYYFEQVADLLGVDKASIKLKSERYFAGSENQNLKINKIKKNPPSSESENIEQEIEKAFDELASLCFKFKLKINISSETKNYLNDSRLAILNLLGLGNQQSSGLQSNEEYVSIITFRSEEQFINWNQDQTNDHKKYLEKKLEKLGLKNKIEEINKMIEQFEDSGSGSDQKMQELLETQLSLIQNLKRKDDD
jgi:DNA primase